MHQVIKAYDLAIKYSTAYTHAYILTSVVLFVNFPETFAGSSLDIGVLQGAPEAIGGTLAAGPHWLAQKSWNIKPSRLVLGA